MTLKPIRPTMVLLAASIALSVFLFVQGASDRQARFEAEREKSQANESAAVEGGDLADQVIAACGRDDAIGQSVREAGLCKSAEDAKETIVDTLDPSTPAPTPSPSASGPSTSQVLAAVSALLPPAVRDMVAARLPGDVDAYCAMRNGCVGMNGTNGTDAPPVTDSRLLSLIQPLIPSPIPGANGLNGNDGRGVAGVSCSSAMSFDLTFSFTDGTTQTLSCGPVDPVTPEPPVDPVEPTQ